ncbi:MAG: hypothetical protein Q7T37_00160 [bacterium]|nr:hypothetical protein [bacterium]MDO8742734.1 hypothetical protein [bacterium]
MYHILLARKGRLHGLYVEKVELQIALSSLGVRLDPNFSRVIIPEENRVKYQQVFGQIRNLQEEIDRVHAAIQATKEEMYFLPPAG